MKLEKVTPFHFSMLRFVEKKINLVFSERIYLMVYTPMLVVPYHMNKKFALLYMLL